MTSWGPDDPSREALSDGREVLAQGSEEPPRRLRALAVAIVAALVVGGGVLANRDGGEEPARSSPEEAGSSAGGREGWSPEAAPSAVREPGTTAPAPTLRELAGVWLVYQGPPSFSPGRMWMAFHTDGSFRLDPRQGLLSKRPWVRGHFHLQDTALTLVVEGGRGCRPGDRFHWAVGTLPRGHLEIRHLSDSGGHCRVVPGVWSARPLRDTDMWRFSWRR